MTASRSLAAAALLAVLAATAAAPAADAPAPRPVVTISARVSPHARPIPKGAPLTVRLGTTFRSVPTGGNFVLQRAEYRFGAGARFNAALFPSCSAAMIRKAHNRLSVCPKGSQVGTGIATGTAVAVGVTSSGRLTIFNGPGGRTLVLHMEVRSPALIEATFEAPIRRLHGGRYAFELATAVPPELQSLLDGDIVVRSIQITTGATRVIGGRLRGYYEASSCPRSGGSAVHGDFQFNQGASATADATVTC